MPEDDLAIDLPALSDERFDAVCADPTIIENHQEAAAVLQELDGDIANIQAQLDAYEIEFSGRTPPEERRSWFRRASHARAFKASIRHRVIMRDKELRKTKGPSTTPAKRDPAVGLAKQARLMVEAENRRADIAARRVAVEQQRSVNSIFAAVAKEKLPPEIYSDLMSEAKSRRAIISQMAAQ